MNPTPTTTPPNGGPENSKGPNDPSANESARIVALLEAHTNAVMTNNEKLSAAEKTHAALSMIEKKIEAHDDRIRHGEILNVGPRVTALERAAAPKQNANRPGQVFLRKTLIVCVGLIFAAAAAAEAVAIGRERAEHARDLARIDALELHLQDLTQRQDIVLRDWHRVLDAVVEQRRQP